MSEAVEAMSPKKNSSNRLLANRKLSRVTMFSHSDQILVLLTGAVIVSCWANSEIAKGRICQASSSAVKQDHFNLFVCIEFSCDGHWAYNGFECQKNYFAAAQTNQGQTNKTPTKTLYCHRRIIFPSFTK